MFAAAKKAFSWISGVVNETSNMISQFQMTTQRTLTTDSGARHGLSMGQIANGMKKLAGEFGGRRLDAYERPELFAEGTQGHRRPGEACGSCDSSWGMRGSDAALSREGAEGVREMEERTKALGGGFAGDGAKGLIAFQSLDRIADDGARASSRASSIGSRQRLSGSAMCSPISRVRCSR